MRVFTVPQIFTAVFFSIEVLVQLTCRLINCVITRILKCVLYDLSFNVYIFFNLYQDYNQRNAYILTQAPLNNTVEDFWRMISQYDIGTVVMLNSSKEENEVYYTLCKFI